MVDMNPVILYKHGPIQSMHVHVHMQLVMLACIPELNYLNSISQLRHVLGITGVPYYRLHATRGGIGGEQIFNNE